MPLSYRLAKRLLGAKNGLAFLSESAVLGQAINETHNCAKHHGGTIHNPEEIRLVLGSKKRDDNGGEWASHDDLF